VKEKRENFFLQSFRQKLFNNKTAGKSAAAFSEGLPSKVGVS